VSATLDVSLGPALTADEAEAIYARGREAVIFALLEMAKQLGEAQGRLATASSPATPSGMRCVYLKPAAKTRKKRPGRKAGHAGARREPPQRIDRYQEHRAKCCPDCGGQLKRCSATRLRYTEDIPAGITPVVTEHTIHRDWCPRCRKPVEPAVSDALPGSTLGNHVLALSAWLHYGLGNTLSQVIEVFNYHLHFRLTKGGLMQQWYRLQAVLYPWYEQIREQALAAAVLHADETGWRVGGKTHWLWCFTDPRLTYYMIDRRRGSPALAKFFRDEFAGTLVSDFWGAYNSVVCGARQTCLAHLLRDLEHVEQYKHPTAQWPAFAKKLRRLLRDAIRLSQRGACDDKTFVSRRERLHARLADLIETSWEDSQARRLVKRLKRHQTDLLTFLDHPKVPFDNNHAERAIRPAVIIRKNSYCNRSERGADTQAVLMSIYRTLKQRGYDPISTISQAVASCLNTGQLPPIPSQTTTDG
jgi:transposase